MLFVGVTHKDGFASCNARVRARERHLRCRSSQRTPGRAWLRWPCGIGPRPRVECGSGRARAAVRREAADDRAGVTRPEHGLRLPDVIYGDDLNAVAQIACLEDFFFNVRLMVEFLVRRPS